MCWAWLRVIYTLFHASVAYQKSLIYKLVKHRTAMCCELANLPFSRYKSGIILGCMRELLCWKQPVYKPRHGSAMFCCELVDLFKLSIMEDVKDNSKAQLDTAVLKTFIWDRGSFMSICLVTHLIILVSFMYGHSTTSTPPCMFSYAWNMVWYLVTWMKKKRRDRDRWVIKI